MPIGQLTGLPGHEADLEAELHRHFTAILPMTVELPQQNLEAILAGGREMVRRQRLRAVIVVAVLVVPVAVAGLMTGAAL
jgi:hypothetical protein